MPSATYENRRGEIEEYFDRTAADAWKRLTSDAPVSGIRATVRAGRDRMRATLLSWLPAETAGQTVLDAGCGTGALAIEAARKGAHVTAIDLSPTLVGLAGERFPSDVGEGTVEFKVGDMFDPALGSFDHVVAMDSLIHYETPDVIRVLEGFAPRVDRSILFTFAPATPLLSTMHAAGRFFPRGDRAPWINPTAPKKLVSLIEKSLVLKNFHVGRTLRIKSGFYTSQAMELKRT
jgi:magnesium-protoporphyrin O-methyltransferase